jgi:hypothetical protein
MDEKPRSAAYRDAEFVPMREIDGVEVGPGISMAGGRMQITGPQHAMSDGASPCGIPEDDLVVVRQLFRPSRDDACQSCAELAQADRLTLGD